MANAISQRAGKQNKFVHISKPFAKSAGAAPEPPKDGRGTETFDAKAETRQLLSQNVGEAPHTLLFVVCIID